MIGTVLQLVLAQAQLLTFKASKMISKTTAVIGVLLLFVVTTSVGQDSCPLQVYCGHQCCLPAIQGCCATSDNPMLVNQVCCTADQTNEVMSCNSVQCPSSLPPDQVYNTDVTPAQLRNQCCQYFREGCCSQSENDFLDLLFKLAIGLGIGLGGLLLIIIILVVCCCCCICCD